MSVAVKAEDEPRIDAAVSAFVDSGERRDTLLDLTTTEGFEFKIRASQISNWMVSTPEGRKRQVELEKMQIEETQAFKEEMGVKPWEDDYS